jgi:hypothetical protein
LVMFHCCRLHCHAGWYPQGKEKSPDWRFGPTKFGIPVRPIRELIVVDFSFLCKFSVYQIDLIKKLGSGPNLFKMLF